MMLNTYILILSFFIIINQCSSPRTLVSTANANKYSLVFSDEFSYTGLPDSTKWQYDVGNACDKPAGCGWGNNELQYYTEARLENARVQDDLLVIEAHREDYEQNNYTSARLLTKMGNYKYGKVEVRAKLPTGRGTWAAIWMLPNISQYGGWPKSGEIDIMEFVGYCPDTVFGTIHTEAYNHLKGTQKGGEIFIENLDDSFHTYTLEWEPEVMHWYVDSVRYFTFEKEGEGKDAWPFDQNFHLILNLAIGGNWGGKHGVDEAVFPQKYLVDFVRIYSQNH